MRLPSLLRQFLAQSLVWTALCLLTESVCGFILHWGFPYNYPAPPATSIFDDFRLYISRFAYFRTPRFFESIPPYPAPASVLYKLFLLPQPTHIRFAVFRYILAILITSWVMLFAFRRALIRHGLAPRSASFFVLGTYLLSYPLWFEVHQANLEFITWGLVTGGLAAYWVKRNRLAAVLLGLAAAIKIVPVLLLGLFLAQKQYRALALALATTALFTLLSLWIWYPDIAYSWHASSVALKGITDMSALQLLLVHSGFDHSLFSLFKRLLPVLPPPAQLAPLLTGYQALTAVAGCILFFVRIRHLPLINQILCLSVAVTLFPPVSYDYTLLELYFSLALLFFVSLSPSAQLSLATRRALVVAIALFAFILSPESELIVHRARVGGQFKAAALLALFVLGLLHRFPSPASLPLQDAPASQDLVPS